MIEQRIIAIIPAYNEERYIGSMVLKVAQYVDHVIVVNDGSIDHTAQLAEAAGAVVIDCPHNQGKGVAMNLGFKVARQMNPDAVITIDADFQHMPDELLQVANPILQGEADIVIGSRYLENTSNVSPQRAMGHRVFTWLTNALSGTIVTDSQSGYRAFSTRSLDVLKFRSQRFAVESEIQFLVQKHSLTVKEIPVTIDYHNAPKRNVISHGLIVLNGIMHLVGQHRPLLYFGGLGLFIKFIGLLFGVRVVLIYNDSSQLAIGSALLFALSIMIGLLTTFTGIILHSIRALILEYQGQS